ncbi:HAD family hydrolase [Spirochaeta africana]|uniref:Haloacid dehalogenase superfamily enzyme, subfamily IA n=1 Tax=Spirochaeta africana (strain ATCC 700263 / DSM 8902 / Z-7692) TaxID=889378 RepID=H9UKH1_SPIAZ|nr:HAD family hydrolase [Spirochaeta africana]AFG38014.1 haloacid dehalogenase superfamily enzyme, subfamily IA [Spirochaeta africana DSM 8902]
MEIHAVVFDVDGTLYPNSAMYRRSLWYGLKNAGFVRRFSRIRKQIRSITIVEDYHDMQAALLGEALGVPRDSARQMISDKVHTWEDLLHGITLVKGLRRFLQQLDDAGIPRGLLSDFPVKRKMDIVGLPDGWACKLSSEDVGYLKPHPAPFRAVCTELGVQPEHVLYVGNSYSYDVIGSKNAGMWAAHLCRKPRKDSIADVTFSDYTELGEWLFSRIDGSGR